MVTHLYKFGDTCPKAFFNFHNGNHKWVFLKTLFVDGRMLTMQNYLTQYAHGFYKQLYVADPEDVMIHEARTESFTLVPRIVTNKMNKKLTKDTSLEELKMVVVALAFVTWQGIRT